MQCNEKDTVSFPNLFVKFLSIVRSHSTTRGPEIVLTAFNSHDCIRKRFVFNFFFGSPCNQIIIIPFWKFAKYILIWWQCTVFLQKKSSVIEINNTISTFYFYYILMKNSSFFSYKKCVMNQTNDTYNSIILNYFISIVHFPSYYACYRTKRAKSSTKNGDQMLIAASTVATGGTTMANVFILSPNGFKMNTMGFTLEITMKLRLTSSLL